MVADLPGKNAERRASIAALTFELALTSKAPGDNEKPISKSDVHEFFTLLHTVIAKPHRTTLQPARRWIMINIVNKDFPSPHRVNQLMSFFVKYAKECLVILDSKTATSLAEIGGIPGIIGTSNSPTNIQNVIAKLSPGVNPQQRSVKARNVALLFLIHQVLVHVTERTRKVITDLIYQTLPNLVEVVATNVDSSEDDNFAAHGQILTMLKVWLEKAFFPRAYLVHLKELAMKSGGIERDAGDQFAALADNGHEISVTLPTVHGNPRLPWYRQPATVQFRAKATPKSRTIQPALVNQNIVKREPGTIASKAVIEAVEDVLAFRRAQKTKQEEGKVMDADEMGRRIVMKPDGSIKTGQTYYGWSEEFCKKQMKKMA